MTAALAPGAPVRVRDAWPERFGSVHQRTPHYLRGREGRVVRRLGAFLNPENLAFGAPAPVVALYHVAFDAAAVWPGAPADGDLLVEIYEHWLEPLP
ncbi:SH3-like domain-containing protein [Lichenibacterium dinghuense]|uniref:SH3-like domain-containing protein n=1 Tax=Lichenibacterium dinghuense TaxID=2895977 RepID=UPI0021066549|nr:SH3-like domain-containing protein [Lichenibacterium sp. 6Y81]